MAIDGCGVPTFAMSLRQMALSFVRLAHVTALPSINFGNAPLQASNACERIWKAVVQNPPLLSNNGAIDCELIRLAKGRLLAKIGAESMFCIAVKPTPRWPLGLGIAIKIEDGTGARARAPVAIEVLRQLEILSEAEIQLLDQLFPKDILNRAGRVVGKMVPVVNLKV